MFHKEENIWKPFLLVWSWQAKMYDAKILDLKVYEMWAKNYLICLSWTTTLATRYVSGNKMQHRLQNRVLALKPTPTEGVGPTPTNRLQNRLENRGEFSSQLQSSTKAFVSFLTMSVQPWNNWTVPHAHHLKLFNLALVFLLQIPFHAKFDNKHDKIVYKLLSKLQFILSI